MLTIRLRTRICVEQVEGRGAVQHGGASCLPWRDPRTRRLCGRGFGRGDRRAVSRPHRFVIQYRVHDSLSTILLLIGVAIALGVLARFVVISGILWVFEKFPQHFKPKD